MVETKNSSSTNLNKLIGKTKLYIHNQHTIVHNIELINNPVLKLFSSVILHSV
jgi:hypothetical protein